ncbi:MAG: DUF1203 domain-containing protein [Candidatus Binataceae bacterium]
MNFRFVAMDSARAERFRRTGLDDSGNPLRRLRREVPEPGYPCRHCLRKARQGELMLLGSYHLERPEGIYWTPSPIFVHAEECKRFQADNELPEVLTGPPLSIRSYDAAHQMIYPLTDVSDGRRLTDFVERSFADTQTRYANIHTAQFGCFLCRVERAEA